VRIFLCLLLACKSPPDKTEPEKSTPPVVVEAAAFDPGDPFLPYANMAELCNRLMIAEGQPLHWRSWTSNDDYAKVCAYYKERAKGLEIREKSDQTEIHHGPGRVLMIYPAALASSHPQCNKPVAPTDKTVVMLSELRMP